MLLYKPFTLETLPVFSLYPTLAAGIKALNLSVLTFHLAKFISGVEWSS